MASWNSYAPLWWQSLYQPSQVDENELPDLDALSQLDGARQHPLEARRKTAGSVSLVGNIAGLPLAPSFENFPTRPLYPLLGSPGTIPWPDSKIALPLFGAGLGTAAATAPGL